MIDAISVNPLSPTLSSGLEQVEIGKDSIADEADVEKVMGAGKPKSQNYVSHSALALRCRVMPPPCIQNPYLKDASEKDIDPFGNKRSKCAGTVLVCALMSFSLSIFSGEISFIIMFLDFLGIPCMPIF